jgi:hypothetical protein
MLPVIGVGSFVLTDLYFFLTRSVYHHTWSEINTFLLSRPGEVLKEVRIPSLNSKTLSSMGVAANYSAEPSKAISRGLSLGMMTVHRRNVSTPGHQPVPGTLPYSFPPPAQISVYPIFLTMPLQRGNLFTAANAVNHTAQNRSTLKKHPLGHAARNPGW